MPETAHERSLPTVIEAFDTFEPYARTDHFPYSPRLFQLRTDEQGKILPTTRQHEGLYLSIPSPHYLEASLVFANPALRETPRQGARYLGELGMPLLASTCVQYANSVEELSHITDKLVEWSKTHPISPWVGRTYLLAFRNALCASMTFSDYTDPTAAAPFVEVLAGIDWNHPQRHRIESAIRTLLAKLLHYDATAAKSAYGHMRIPANHRPIAIRTISTLDRAGVLQPEFWSKDAITGGLAITEPRLLPLLRDKLESPAGPETVAALSKVKEYGVADYIARLLEHYSQDPLRHTTNAALLRRRLRPDGRPEGTVDLGKLISFANELVERFNGGLTELEQLAPLPADESLVSDALVRLLFFTRGTGVGLEVSTSQYEVDMMHADVVALIRERGKSRRRDRALAQVALQSSGLEGHQLVTAQSLIARGMPATEAIALVSSQS